MKRDCHDRLPSELLLSWTPEQMCLWGACGLFGNYRPDTGEYAHWILPFYYANRTGLYSSPWSRTETFDGDVGRRRYVPSGEVTEVGDVTASDSAITQYELTITVYPDGDGVLYLDFTDDPQAVDTGS